MKGSEDLFAIDDAEYRPMRDNVLHDYVKVARSMMFFFFQAEDGIRDGTVTGVQTCALPICRRSRRGLWRRWLSRRRHRRRFPRWWLRRGWFPRRRIWRPRIQSPWRRPGI